MGCLTTWRTAFKAKWRWVLVVAASMLAAVTFGFMYSFGLLMVALIEEFGSGVTETGYVGTSSFGISMVACLITSPLTTKIGYRLAVFLGVTLCVVASITTSFAPSISVMIFSYGCLYGLGCSFILCCVVNCTVTYFPNKHRSLAIAFVSAGFNIGVLVFNPVVYTLINWFGWRTMMRVMSGIIAVTGCFCVPMFTPASAEPCPVADGPKDDSARKGLKFERELQEDSNCDNVIPQRTNPRAATILSSVQCISSGKPENSISSRTFHENDASAKNSVKQILYQKCSSKQSHKPELQGSGSVLAAVDGEPRHFDRTAEGLHKARGHLNSSADSLKGFADGQTGKPRTWFHGLGILRMPETWLIQLGFVTAAVAMSFAYFSTVNMTISSGFSKKTAAMVMVTMGSTEIVGKIALGVITDRLPIPKIFILMAANCVGALLMFVMAQIAPSKSYIFFQAAVQGMIVLASINSLSYSLGEQIFRDEYRLHVWTLLAVSLGVGGTLGAVFGESVDKTGSYQMAYYGNVGVFLASATVCGLAIAYQRVFARDRFILFERVGRRYSAVNQKDIEKPISPDRNGGFLIEVSGLKNGNKTGECKFLIIEKITSL
ncbi:uncharacterized protein [Diadema setosum]|uniref:uncharacterized protein n=1 Tax=Diadema setosum TaxID=31175 RepID=UPI003B3A6C9B